MVRTGVGSKRCPNSRRKFHTRLSHETPDLLPPGGVAAPAIRVLLDVFIGQSRLKGAAMQIQFNDVGGGESLLRQVAEKEFVDDARSRDAHRTLLLAGRMRGNDHAAQPALGANWHVWAIVEAAYHLAFRTLLHLIGRQVQACLHERMIEDGVLLAAGHEGEARQIGEDRSRAILAKDMQQGAPFRQLVRARQ